MRVPVTAVLVWLLLCAIPGASATPLELRQAWFTMGAPGVVPGADAGWLAQPLPDQWVSSRPGVSGTGWYRFRFTLEKDSAALPAVFLPRVIMNATVYLNGVALGSGGRMIPPVTRNWNRPLYFLMPPRLLRSGENELLVEVVSLPYSQGALMPIEVGDDRELRPRYDRLHFLRITLNEGITALVVLLGLAMLSLWWRRRKDTMYAYFGAASLIWAFNSCNLFVRSPPVSNELWEALVTAAYPGFGPLLMASLLRLIERPRPLLERLMWPMLPAAVLSLVAAPEHIYGYVAAFWYVVALGVSVFVLVELTGHAWRIRTVESALLVCALSVSFLFGVHDWLMNSKLLWYSDAANVASGELHLVNYAAPLLFSVIGWILSARFVTVLNEYERLNLELEQRVSAKHQELEANFHQIERITRERAALEERERIVADMHDGLGSQLVTTLRLVESGRVDGTGTAELLRDCLDDMRTVMQSMTPGAHDLDALLGALRHRLAARLVRAGIALDWHFDGTLPDYPLGAHDALHVQRIMQECFANILKHANASRIVVESGADPALGRRRVRITDNGQGIRGEHRGRGIANMRSRAIRIGAELSLQSSAAGTVVELLLPPANAG